MTWTIDEIEKSWLAGGRVAVSPDEMVAAFERCDHVLGRDWIDAQRAREVGAGSTLAVVRTARQLASLEGVANASTLIEKLRRRDRYGASELHALHLLRFGVPITAEMYPPLTGSYRKPDIRARSLETWVYIEVTQPRRSEARRRAEAALRAVTDLVERIKLPVTLENFLRREPASDDIETIRVNAARFCAATVAAGELPFEGIPPEKAILFFRH
jgi:hypothetical protein